MSNADTFNLDNKISAFASKKIGDKNLFKRGHGITKVCAIGENETIFVVNYAWAKITALEIINGSVGDTVSLFVLDSTVGTYTSISNYVLNQFAYNLNVAEKFYSKKSEYDADLYAGMQIKIVYNSVNEKTIGLNFDLNEVK